MKLPGRVTFREVGTRDGFQIEPELKRVQEIVGRVPPGQIVKAGKWTRRYPLPDGVRERLPAPS
jgi:hypothetical protein